MMSMVIRIKGAFLDIEPFKKGISITTYIPSLYEENYGYAPPECTNILLPKEESQKLINAITEILKNQEENSN